MAPRTGWRETPYSQALDAQRRREESPAFMLSDGRVLVVSAGIGGDIWGTFWIKPSGALRRFTALPMCDSRQQAEHGLAAYAAAKGLARIDAEAEAVHE